MNRHLLEISNSNTPRSRHFTVVAWLAILIVEILIALLAVVSPLSAICTVLALAAVFLILKPERAVYILALSIIPSPMLAFRLGVVNLESAYLLAMLAMISWALARLTKIRPPCPKSDCDQAMLLFGLWALVSLLWSQDRLTGYEDMTRLFFDIAIIFLIRAVIKENKMLRMILICLVFMGVIEALLTILYPYSTFFVVKTWTFHEIFGMTFKFWPKNAFVAEGRGMGFYPAHGTAVTVSISLIFGIMLFIVTKSRRKRLFLLAVTGLLFAALICTLTKSLIAGFMLGTAYISLHLKPLRQRIFTTMFVLVMLIVVMFVLTRIRDLKTAAVVTGESMFTVGSDAKTTSTGSRVVLFGLGVQKLWETGGLGTGIGGFLQYSPYGQMDGSHPAVLFDLGFVGFAIWFWLLWGAYRLFVRTMRECKNERFRRLLLIYLGGYIDILVCWLVTFSYAFIHIWFYLGVGFALVHLAKQSSSMSDEALPFAGKDGGTIVVC